MQNDDVWETKSSGLLFYLGHPCSVSIELMQIDIENNPTCTWDWLQVIYADQEQRYCGTSVEDPRAPSILEGSGISFNL